MKRLRIVVLGLLVLALAVAAVTRLISNNGPVAATGAPGLEDFVVPGAGVIRWSPDATQLALVVAGEVVIVGVADGQEVLRRGATVVDVAWMPDGGRVIIAEGPIPTGQVVALRVDGRVAGTTKLRPSIAFGQGQGLAVDSRGTQAAVISARRDPIGGATHHDLGLVQLQSGQTRVFPTDGRNETNPVFVDDTNVAYASAPPNEKPQLQALDSVSGEVVSLGAIEDGPFGVLASGEIVVGRRTPRGVYRLEAVDLTGASRVLGVLGNHQRPVAIDPFGTRVLVRRFGDLQGTRLAIAVLSK